jgi:hypothetical protein
VAKLKNTILQARPKRLKLEKPRDAKIVRLIASLENLDVSYLAALQEARALHEAGDHEAATATENRGEQISTQFLATTHALASAPSGTLHGLLAKVRWAKDFELGDAIQPFLDQMAVDIKRLAGEAAQ